MPLLLDIKHNSSNDCIRITKEFEDYFEDKIIKSIYTYEDFECQKSICFLKKIGF